MKEFNVVFDFDDDPIQGICLTRSEISAIEKEFSLFKAHKGKTFDFGVQVSMTSDSHFLSLYEPFVYEDWEIRPFCKYQAFKPLHKEDAERLKSFLRNFEYYDSFRQCAKTLSEEKGVFFLFSEEW